MSPTPDTDADRAFEAYKAENYGVAFRLLRTHTEAGDVEAQCMLATIYHLGLGVVDPDGRQAVHWYKEAAAAGSPLACNNLWSIYTNGWYGVVQDKAEARRWYEEAKRR